MDNLYTNGVIAVKEKNFLNDRLLRFCEMSAEEAFRALVETGFGSGGEASGIAEVENLIAADERDIDGFIRQYAPSDNEKQYLLAPRDFHNAKALVKAKYLSCDTEGMLAPEGIYPVETLSKCINEGDFTPLCEQLAKAIEEVEQKFSDENAGVSGAEIGAIFEKAKFLHLSKYCKRGVLKKLLIKRADMTNILTAVRSPDEELAQTMYVSGGKLKESDLKGLFDSDPEKAAKALKGTAYASFTEKCVKAKAEGKPLTEAERELDSTETAEFYERRFELEERDPFLYYVFRRRAENTDVRIVFVCLSAGMKESEIRRRLRLKGEKL